MPKDTATTTRLDVLFVDDSASLCRAMEIWLKSSGYSAETAPTATEAEAVALRKRPRVIVTDIGLPDFSGYDLYRKLIDAPGMGPTRFIALSGRRDRSRSQQAIDAGFDAYLAKPPDFEELAALLDKYLPESPPSTD